MPKTRVIVSTTNPKDGSPLAAGQEVDLDDDAYNALRATGAVEASEQEVKEHATPEAEGNFSARTGRENVTGTRTEQPRAQTPPKPPEEPPARKK